MEQGISRKCTTTTILKNRNKFRDEDCKTQFCRHIKDKDK